LHTSDSVDIQDRLSPLGYVAIDPLRLVVVTGCDYVASLLCWIETLYPNIKRSENCGSLVRKWNEIHFHGSKD
jgi:hypothetical protein